MANSPKAPKGTGTAGRRLWRAVLRDYELAEHELTLLREACRTADLCEELQDEVNRTGLLVDGKTSPALVELRQQRILLARLVVALRVPIGDQEDESRDQRRGTRGFYGIRGAV